MFISQHVISDPIRAFLVLEVVDALDLRDKRVRVY